MWCEGVKMLVKWVMCVALVNIGAQANIDVVRITMQLEEERTLQVDNSVEYILQFVPSAEQSLSPARVEARLSGGLPAAPVLLTARTYTGAQTWQLPYWSESGERLHYELERTLCPPNGSDDDDHPCVDSGSAAARGWFSVHVSSSCAVPLTLHVRAAPRRPWILPLGQPLQLQASETAAAVVRYEFPDQQDSVRLVFTADDDVCAILSVHQYERCPIPETTADVEGSGLRMTVQRSGGVQLARSAFPRGFVVVCTVLESDAACVQARPGAEEPDTTTAAAPARHKQFSLEARETLSRRQYVAASVVTVAAFLAVYVWAGALVLARRLPRLAPLLAPKAPLADVVSATTATTGVDSDGGHPTSPAQHQRRRRDSTTTYDSCDASDSDDEEEGITQGDESGAGGEGGGAGEGRNGVAMTALDSQAGPAGGDPGGPRPFGLPARLNVAVLSRRRAATLRARSDRYLTTLYTVAVFYALPVVQFVVAFQVVLNVSGSLDLCYFNFLCAHPAGALSDFNHVFSNVGYLLLGALFMLHVRRRRLYRRRFPKHEEYGIPAHYGLLSSLGLGLMVVAVLSASYHVCPNRLNFQFDTAFMYVLAVLSMVKMYQARHPDVAARAHATFGMLALLIALVVWGVLGGGAQFWAVWTVLHVLAMLLLSLRIYYVGQFRFDKQSVAETLGTWRPLYGARLALLAAANLVNWAFAIYGILTLPHDFPSHLLFILLSNTLLYMISYLIMKALHGECLRWYSWLMLAGAAATWAPALYFFTYGSTDWADTPAASRQNNHECKVMEFYDAHDLWHLLSALAMYLSFCAMLTWDDGLSAVKRTDIPVF